MLSLSQLQPVLEPALDELGLTEYEKKLYLLSLSFGPIPVSVFAKHLGISRPNVYKVILGLEKHGLAVFSERPARARTFAVESPHALLKQLKEKRERMEKVDRDVLSILPDVLALYQQSEHATSLKVFDTKEGWVETFFQVLNETKGEYLFFGNVETFSAFAPTVQERWVAERVKRQIRGRLLTLPGLVAEQKTQHDDEELRETRILKTAPRFDASFLIFGKKAILWQPRAPLAIQVEDASIVAMLQAMFEVLWMHSK